MPLNGFAEIGCAVGLMEGYRNCCSVRHVKSTAATSNHLHGYEYAESIR